MALGNSETGACTFTMTGGTVANNQLSSDDPADPYFGGGIYASYSAVNIKGGTISGNSAWGEYDTFGGGVSVEFGTFSMTGGVISGNEASCGGGISIFEAESAAITQADADVPAIISGNSAYSGGGIYADHAAFSMTGGTVSDNEAYGLGGGIYTYAVKLDLSGSSIDNNVAANGGGIYFTGDWKNYDNDYTLTVAENALIENNEATESGDIYGGGGIFADYAKMVMEGGAISNNTAGYGGGVLAYNTAVLTLKGGAVSGNHAENGGGIYAVEYAEVAISGGTVSGNTAEIDGGGILTEGDSALTMRSGTVSGNSARSGGGICLSNGTFKMSGGKIIGNTAQEYYYGGGVYAGISGVELSGSPVISGNTAGSIANDLEINRTTGNSITVVGAFTNGANIGIIDQQNRTMADFTSGYSAYNTADPADYFFADEKDHGVQLNENGEIEVVDGTYTVIFVGLDGTETSRTFDMGADITLDAVAAQEGCAGGWTTHEGGATIVYDGGQTVSGGLGSRHGQTIYLYEVQERGLGGDIDRITAGLTEAVEAVNTALEGGTATDLATALSDLADACKAADDALAADIAADLTELKNTLNAAEETIDAAIEGVKKDLGDAVTDLEGAMAAKADSAALAQAIDELTAAYTAADELINADIDGMEEDMSALEGRLDEALATLQESIHTVQTGLESETERLEGLINASGTDTAELKDALEALDAAYKAADVLLRTDLAAADEALADEIAADIAELGASLESADEAVRDALDALRAEVDKNASGIAGLTAALWAVGAVAVIALCCAVAGIVLAVKAGKSKKSENGD